ncbi:MAG: hypothetical protein ACHQE6_08835 [Solirubrobacterales bacterium]
MTLSRIAAARLLAVGVLLGAASCSLAPVAETAARPPFRPLVQSPELWATVDMCNTAHHPHAIGIRGSMPTDGHPHDTMYMRFLVQSLDASTHQWADLGKSADSGFVPIGSAASTRQAGRTFEFKPAAATYTLRGYVEFQWRRAGRVVHLLAHPTAAGHTSLAGAEPKGFSAATCTLK